MKKIINIYKPLGSTPLQLIQELRQKESSLQNVKIGFAGRLDPLAHGVMLLMIGDETKERSKYLGLKKEYDFQVLFGVSTDTYDALGLLEKTLVHKIPDKLLDKLIKFTNKKIGKYTQPYPPYSSKEVNGIPLYVWARENRLHEIDIPTKDVEIYNFELLDLIGITSAKLKRIIIRNIQNVTGDFRQKEIMKSWNDFFKQNMDKSFTLGQFRISCSSGTYVRGIANELGNYLGTGAITLDILRTRVGDFALKDSIK